MPHTLDEGRAFLLSLRDALDRADMARREEQRAAKRAGLEAQARAECGDRWMSTGDLIFGITASGMPRTYGDKWATHFAKYKALQELAKRHDLRIWHVSTSKTHLDGCGCGTDMGWASRAMPRDWHPQDPCMRSTRKLKALSDSTDPHTP